MEVTERRTAVDFAAQMRWLVYEAYPDAKVVRVVLDNLNTHKLGSLYEAYEPVEARRIARRLQFHHTPKHGSWLNMAEIELSVFSKQYPMLLYISSGFNEYLVWLADDRVDFTGDIAFKATDDFDLAHSFCGSSA